MLTKEHLEWAVKYFEEVIPYLGADELERPYQTAIDCMKQHLDLAAENELLKAKIDAVRAECKRKQYGFAEYILKILDKEGY